MSTPEHPDTPPLTRKQLREIRNTGATPVIDTASIPAEAELPSEIGADAESAPVDESPVAPPPVEASLPPVAPFARAAEPIVLPEPPVADSSVDLGVAPLTRRQARQQERIRTASVPVITPDIAAAYAAQATDAVPSAVEPVVEEPVEAVDEVLDEEPAVTEDETAQDPFAALGVTSGAAPVIDDPEAVEAPEHGDAQEAEAYEHEVEAEAHEVEAADEPEAAEPAEPAELSESDDEEADAEAEPEWPFPADDHEAEAPRVVDPAFGAALLAGTVEPQQALQPSFDELITRSSSGSVATPNALILSQSPDAGPLVAPVAATGEVIITGTFNLPEGLGSTGHALGTADGKEVDAVLVDGELPAHSSPTPIAASAAISTVKTPGEIIKPPTPEKGGRLMLTLAITAGVLALALVGVLILAFATGVF